MGFVVSWSTLLVAVDVVRWFQWCSERAVGLQLSGVEVQDVRREAQCEAIDHVKAPHVRWIQVLNFCMTLLSMNCS